MLRKYLLIICSVFTLTGFAQPVIDSFTPGSGPVGTMVTIKGAGFSATPGENVIFFGAVKATITDATDTALIVVVPAGSTYQPISVTVNKLSAYSVNPFIVTFAGGGSFTANSFLPKIDFTTGMYPHSTALADFNNDGKPDLLVSRGSSNVVTIFPNTSINGNISFDGKLDFPATGNNHEGCATGDLDGDGKLDFVITNSNNLHSVSVYRNTSNGTAITFASNMDYPVDNSPYAVAIGDLDSDGKPDMAIVNSGSDKISIYKNISTPGNISFNTRTDLTAGSSPYGIAIGDLDADGKPELVFTTQSTSSSLLVMKNSSTTGTISFETPLAYATFGAPFTVSIGDLDGDGKPDLAAASGGSNSIVVVRNTSEAGNISFALDQYFTAGNYPVCVSISDIDGDGKPDLTTANRYSDDVSVLRNNSMAGTISFEPPIDYGAGDDPFYVTAGDLDGDERPDIISANSAATAISVLRNMSGYNLAPVIDSFTPTSGVQGTSVTIRGSNFTGATTVKFGNIPASSFLVDSATGITAIVAKGASGAVSVTNNYGTATRDGFTFNGPIIYSFSPTVGATGTIVTITGVNFAAATEVKFGGTAAASFTINNDGLITATVGAGSSGSVTVTTSNGLAELAGFSFGAPTITSVSPLFGPVGSAVIITGTNFDPVATGNTVYFGAVKATVTTASSSELSVIVPAGATYQAVSVTSNKLTAYSALPFSVSFQSDTTEITSNSFAIAANFGTGLFPSSIAICDFNDDGKPDLVTANSVSNTVTVVKNGSQDGNISFIAKIDLVSGPDPKRIAIADLDGDGKKDIVVTNTNSGQASTISVFRNTSSGTTISFTPKADYPTGNGTIGISIADLNGDGKPDIVVTSGNSGFFSIFINTTVSGGPVSFAPKQDFTLFTHPDNVITADMNKDGRTDIIVVGSASTVITVYLNLSTGGNLSIAQAGEYNVENFPSFITTGDMNGDERLDVIVTNYSSGSVSFLANITTGSYITFATRQNLPLATTNITVTDLNGDRKPDMVSGQYLSGNISVHENTHNGSGSFSFADSVNFTTGTYDTYVSAGDLDGDGKPELAVANTIPNTITILKNRINLPAITSLSETSSRSGSTVTINGRNLSGATAVKFGGSPAGSFNIVSSTKIEAIVGGGASGNITVTTPGGTATIAGFSFVPEITANGPTTFCGDKVVLLSSTAALNNQWYKNAVAVNGATNKTLQVNESGVYTVKTTGNGITTTSPAGITVTVTTTPSPTITRDANNNLVSSAASGNQWYFNGNLIAGAVNQFYLPPQNGLYSVTSTINSCTSILSAAYNFVLTGIINLGNGQYIKLYPNPVKDNLNISWNISSTPLLNILIADVEGKQILLKSNLHSGTAINLAGLPAGLYFLKIYNKQFKISENVKILKE